MIENINFIEGSTLSGTFTIKSIIPGKMINEISINTTATILLVNIFKNCERYFVYVNANTINPHIIIEL